MLRLRYVDKDGRCDRGKEMSFVYLWRRGGPTVDMRTTRICAANRYDVLYVLEMTEEVVGSRSYQRRKPHIIGRHNHGLS